MLSEIRLFISAGLMGEHILQDLLIYLFFLKYLVFCLVSSLSAPVLEDLSCLGGLAPVINGFAFGVNKIVPGVRKKLRA